MTQRISKVAAKLAITDFWEECFGCYRLQIVLEPYENTDSAVTGRNWLFTVGNGKEVSYVHRDGSIEWNSDQDGGKWVRWIEAKADEWGDEWGDTDEEPGEDAYG